LVAIVSIATKYGILQHILCVALGGKSSSGCRWCWWDDYAAGKTRIKALVGASCLHGPPAGVFAWRGVSVPHVSWWRRSCPRLAPRVKTHTPVRVGGGARAGWRLVVSGGELLCKAETCRARWWLVGGGPPVGNWSEMLPSSREHDVLPVRVLTGVLSLPRLESWSWHCQSWPPRCQWCWITLC
jgi:hypothetical protein